MTPNNENTRTLELVSIFHYVLAALIYLKGAMSFILIGIGTIAIAGILSDRPKDMHIAIFVIALIFYAGPMVFLCLTWTMATLVLLAGKRIGRRANLAFCQIIAGLECLCVPFGTILGIYTLIALTKSDVKQQFDIQSA